MKKFFLIPLLCLLAYSASAQSPIIISQPYIFNKYVKVMDSLTLPNIGFGTITGHVAYNQYGKLIKDTSSFNLSIYVKKSDTTASTGFRTMGNSLSLAQLQTKFNLYAPLSGASFSGAVIGNAGMAIASGFGMTVGNGTNGTFQSFDGYKVFVSGNETDYQHSLISFKNLPGGFRQDIIPTTGTTSANAIFSLPNKNANDTFMMLSDAAGYVPYTDATGNINSAYSYISSSGTAASSSNGLSGSSLRSASFGYDIGDGTPSLDLYSGTNFGSYRYNNILYSDGTHTFNINRPSSLSGTTTATFRDLTGTVALTSDLGAYMQLAGGNSVTGIQSYTASGVSMSLNGAATNNAIQVSSGSVDLYGPLYSRDGTSIISTNASSPESIISFSNSGVGSHPWQFMYNSSGFQLIHNGVSASLTVTDANNAAIQDNASNYFAKNTGDANGIINPNASSFASLGVGTGSTSIVGKLQTVETATTATRGVNFQQYSTDGKGSRVNLDKYRGTFNSPLTIVSGDTTLNIAGRGYDGTNPTNSVQWLGITTGTFGTGIVPGIMQFKTANSSGTLTNGLQINADQTLQLPHYTTNGLLAFSGSNGTIGVASSSAYVASITNSDGSLTISPTTGSAVASLNQAHGNSFSVNQQFSQISYQASPVALFDQAPSSFSTASTFGTTGLGFNFGPTTFNSTSSTGTIAVTGLYTFAQPTVTASNATTLTALSTVYIAGIPISSTNIINSTAQAYGLYSNGLIGANAGLNTGNGTSSNFVTTGSTFATTGITTASLLFGGASQINARAWFNGASSTTLTAGNSYTNVEIGAAPFTKAGSGTSAWGNNLTVQALGTVGAGAGALTNTSTLYVNGQSTAGTNNYGLFLAAGANYAQAGSSSGIITFQTQAAAGTYNKNWATTSGTAGQVETSGGGGSNAETWSNVPINQASANLTAQTAAGNITTFTVGSATATFNISAYINVTAVATDVIQAQITYTDENNTSQTVSFTTLSTVTNSTYSPITIRAKNGTVITLKTNLTTGIGSITFDAGGSIIQN